MTITELGKDSTGVGRGWGGGLEKQKYYAEKR